MTFVRKPLTALALCATVLVPGAMTACSKSTTDNVDVGVSSIIFIKRQHTTVDSSGNVAIDVAGGNGQVIDYDRYVPGGSLNILSPARPDGNLINLTAEFPTADFNGVDVSFDATQAVFSMKRDDSDHYHIYTVQLSPGSDGKYEIHQKTLGDQDDINPVYIPGGRIAFGTNQMYTAMGTRADEYEHGRVVTQLATITVDGGDADRHLLSQNLSHTVAPYLRYDGKVGYSRWEHLGPVNDVKLFAANPDGTQMLAVSGQHGKPSNSLFSVKEIAPNQYIAIGTTRSRTIHAGSLIQIDARNQNDPTCLQPNTDLWVGHACLDEEHAQMTVLTPDVPTGNGPSPAGRYREPSVLPDGRLLVSWADGPVNDLNQQSETPPDFGVYLFDPKTQKNQLVYNDRNMWDLGALPVVARKEPPVIGDLQRAPDASQPVRIGSVNVRTTSLQESISGAEFSGTPLSDALNGAVKVRIIEGFSSEAAKGVTMFGLTMHEGAAVLGEADVYADGSWLANVPPYIPMHVQPIDKWGMSIRSQGLWIQGMPGEDRRCVGCHESRVGQGVPAFGQNPTVAEQHGAQDFASQPIAARVEYPWDKNDDPAKNYVQQIFDAKCVQCHNDTKNGNMAQDFYTVSMTSVVTGTTSNYKVPRFDLCGTTANQYCSGQGVTVYYDRQVRTYPASYVSIFYPAALEMGKVKVTGTVPPKWAIPADSRNSEMIAHINMMAADNTTAWPLSQRPMHPENQGVTLTADERLALVRSIDLGGQFYARQNTQFVPNSNDPVAPGTMYK